MKKLIAILLGVIAMSSCSEKVELFPNQNQAVMKTVVFQEALETMDEIIEVDAYLSLNCRETINENSGCRNIDIFFRDGAILSPFGHIENANSWLQGYTFKGLAENEKFQNNAIGDWSEEFSLTKSVTSNNTCVSATSLKRNSYTHIGFRFEKSSDWHYGYITFFTDADGNIRLETVSYNEQLGGNFKIKLYNI